jgi:hypothetical protein
MRMGVAGQSRLTAEPMDRGICLMSVDRNISLRLAVMIESGTDIEVEAEHLTDLAEGYRVLQISGCLASPL